MFKKNTTTIGSVVNLDEVRRKRQENILTFVRPNKTELNLSEHVGLTPEVANSISVEKAFEIARGILKKYSANRSLLSAYLARRKREPTAANDEQFHVVLRNQKSTVAEFTTINLRALFAIYARVPGQFFEIYVYCAAEEYLSRFPKRDL